MNAGVSPLVSVVIPVFNAELFIEAAIASVLSQTFENLELLIIDDGSTDKTLDVVNSTVRRFPGRRITVISRENRGLSRTLNQGLELTTGKYWAYLGADDIWHTQKLEKQVAELESSGFAAAFSDCLVIDAGGNLMSRYGAQFPYHGGDIYRDLVWCKFQPASPTNLYRRDALESVGRFNEDQLWEDRDLWIRLAKDNNIAYIDEPLASYRVHAQNGSSVNLDNMYKYSIQCLDAAVGRDPELAPSYAGLRADIDAFQSAAFFEKLEMRDARRFAVKAIRKRPFNRLAWRTFILSLLGKQTVAKIRGKRRKSIADNTK